MKSFRRLISSVALVLGLAVAVQAVNVPVAKAAVQQVADDEAPSPVIALILGLLIPGAGHIYAGESGTGWLIIGLCVANWLLIGICLSFVTFGLGALLAWVIHIGLLIWGAWGGYNAAKRAGGNAKKDMEKAKKKLDDESRAPISVRPVSVYAY